MNIQYAIKDDRVYVLEVNPRAVSYTHLRAHETVLDLVCRLLLEKKKKQQLLIHIGIKKPNEKKHSTKLAQQNSNKHRTKQCETKQ